MSAFPYHLLRHSFKGKGSEAAQHSARSANARFWGYPVLLGASNWQVFLVNAVLANSELTAIRRLQVTE